MFHRRRTATWKHKLPFASSLSQQCTAVLMLWSCSWSGKQASSQCYISSLPLLHPATSTQRAFIPSGKLSCTAALHAIPRLSPFLPGFSRLVLGLAGKQQLWMGSDGLRPRCDISPGYITRLFLCADSFLLPPVWPYDNKERVFCPAWSLCISSRLYFQASAPGRLL